ncbi:MAG: O-antigen ligase family protein [Phycisphaerae bacterium]|nr:O-antigen ligase family protein [Phycisphaerae bacterium]
MARHHPHLDPGYVASQLDAPARADPRAHRLHVAAAAFLCFFVGFPVSFVEIASIPLFVIGLFRLRRTYRTALSFGAQPLFLVVVAWMVWHGLSIRWSPDPAQGWREFGNCRWFWVTFMLWPVARARPVLIAALAAGLLCGAASQVVNALGHATGARWLMLTPNADRNAGWWEPIVGGTLLTAGLGLHLPAALMGRGRERLIACAGAVVMLSGVIATGTRGAWIASAGLLAIVGAVAAVRSLRRGSRGEPKSAVRAVLAWGLAAVVVAGLVWLLAGSAIGRRVEQARTDLAAAARGEYRTDTGARLLMWTWAIREASARPLTGVGAGGFRAWARAHAADYGEDAASQPLHTHAHSAPLQIAATTGLVGVVLAGLVMGIAVRGGLRELGPAGDEGGREAGGWWGARGGIGSYAAGPGFALIGMALAGLFDPIHQTTITGAWLAILMGLCLVGRPTPLVRAPAS